MAIYIKFDRMDVENINIARLQSYFYLVQLFQKEWDLKKSISAKFRTLPLKSLNDNLTYHSLQDTKKESETFFGKEINANEYGIEILSDFSDTIKISFLLLPEVDTRHELPDVSISLHPSLKYETIEDLASKFEIIPKLRRVVENYKNDRNQNLPIRKIKMTQKDDIFHPQNYFSYYSNPKDFVIDLIRFAKQNSHLKGHLDLMNENKIGTLIYNNNNTRDCLSKLYKNNHIQTLAGSLYLIPDKPEDANSFYQQFEKRILDPVSMQFPTRQNGCENYGRTI